MSSRAAAKARARALREDREQRAVEGQQQRRRLLQMAIVLLAAAFVVGALIVVSQSGDDSGGAVDGGAEAAALFAGIPQSGNALGDPRARRTMVEFADVQCPFCAQYSGDALPEIVRRYVRPGRARLELNLVSSLGPDSERGARAAVAAGLQDRMWQFMEVLYANQGAENSGYVSDAFIRDVADQVPGLDAGSVLADMDRPAVSHRLAGYERRAQQLGVEGVPSFFVGGGGGALRKLEISSLEVGSFTDALGSASPPR